MPETTAGRDLMDFINRTQTAQQGKKDAGSSNVQDPHSKPGVSKNNRSDKPSSTNLGSAGNGDSINAGGTGSLIFLDCDGAQVGTLSWSQGLITTNGDQTIVGGCIPYTPGL